jgi:hypothetical protein
MVIRSRTVVALSCAAALAVFCVVQDRVTADGARRYVRLQREALAGRGAAVTIDEVMGPANERSARQGLLWGGVVLGAGLAIAVAARVSRRADGEGGRGRQERP